jgi:hypothetical protein
VVARRQQRNERIEFPRGGWEAEAGRW